MKNPFERMFGTGSVTPAPEHNPEAEKTMADQTMLEKGQLDAFMFDLHKSSEEATALVLKLQNPVLSQEECTHLIDDFNAEQQERESEGGAKADSLAKAHLIPVGQRRAVNVEIYESGRVVVEEITAH